jgi:uncharacterized membrane protein
MSQFLIAFSLLLHSLATILLIGYYLLLCLIYLPAITAKAGETVGVVLCDISKRSRPWLYASLLTFAATGIYLMLVNPDYHGIGNFNNPWAILMLVKHIIIMGMLAIGFWFNAILRVGPQMGAGSVPAIGRFCLSVNLMAILGVLVLILTALAQIQ